VAIKKRVLKYNWDFLLTVLTLHHQSNVPSHTSQNFQKTIFRHSIEFSREKKRDRERERQKERQKEIKRERETERETEKERKIERER
jgi:hypothetical protein